MAQVARLALALRLVQAVLAVQAEQRGAAIAGRLAAGYAGLPLGALNVPDLERSQH